MRVFLDTNVLVSAVHTRGLCADVFRTCLANHDLVLGETVLKELWDVLRRKLGIPEATVGAFDAYLKGQAVVIGDPPPLALKLRDISDLPILAEALAGSVDVLVTGDAELVEVGALEGVQILSPRGFWELLRGTPGR